MVDGWEESQEIDLINQTGMRHWEETRVKDRFLGWTAVCMIGPFLKVLNTGEAWHMFAGTRRW